MLEKILTFFFKGIIYSMILSVIGVAFSFFKGWELLKGAYIFVLVAGVLTIVLSVALLIGTPDMRRDFFDKSNMNPGKGGEGIGPAIMGAVMIAIGLFLEALMH